MCSPRAQRDHRAEHREPDEQHAGELVGPGDRLVEDVAREGAAAEQDDLGEHEQRRRNLDGMSRARCAQRDVGRCLVGNRFAELHPAEPSRRCEVDLPGRQASGPRVFLEQAPDLAAELALPLGVEAGGLQHGAERLRCRAC